jgi:hypothetical protein
VTDVAFALDVSPSGALVFPASEFVYGVTRVYVRFSYQGLGALEEIESRWYLNDNLISTGLLAWDGGDQGDYLIWIEDPNGLGRGEWRWELVTAGEPLGGDAFVVGGEPRYVNPDWGISLDPPAAWEIASEQASFVTFSGPDERVALALRVAPAEGGLEDVAAADLEIIQTDHPGAELVTAEPVTMSGAQALLQQLRYDDPERHQESLFVVSALRAGVSYSLFLVGPADQEATLKRLLGTTLHSIRFLTAE